MQPVLVKTLFSLMLMALALSLTGCAVPSAPPSLAGVTCPAIPAVPQISQPLPSVSYSDRARLSFKKWREQLTATPLTSKP